MKRKRDLILRTRGRKVVFLLAALSLLAAVMPAQAEANAITPVKYWISIKPQRLSLCPGEEAEIFVYLFKKVEDSFPESVRQGIRIGGIPVPEELGRLSPPHPNVNNAALSTTIQRFPGDFASALFTFRAEKPGIGRIELGVWLGAIDPDLGSRIPTSATSIDVEVKPCYAAYASGLTTMNVGNEWSDADICDLEKPFTLAATGKQNLGQVSATTGSTVLKFEPSSDPSHGTYTATIKEVIQSPAGTQVCFNSGNGGYDVTWYDPGKKSEGDIHLHGTYSQCGQAAPSNFDIRVAIRTLKIESPSLYSCKRP